MDTELPELRANGGTAGTSVSSTEQRRVDSWQDSRIHPAGSGAEEEAIRNQAYKHTRLIASYR